jgi:hypothetical protein
MTHYTRTLAEINELLTVLRQADGILASYLPDVFTETSHLLTAMQPGQVGGIRGLWHRLTKRRGSQRRRRDIGAWLRTLKQSVVTREDGTGSRAEDHELPTQGA